MEEFPRVEVMGEVGRGAFGVVYLAEQVDTKEQFAVKVVELREGTRLRLKDEKEEAELLGKLDHVNIVRYITSYELTGALFIVTEFCAGGDLHTYLYNTSDDKVPEDLILVWAVQITKAVEYLHSRNVLHRDLKPANVYLTSQADVRVGDLGLARVLANAYMTTRSLVGTPAYSSPEILRGFSYNRKTDIWSLGCIILEMAERKKACYNTTLLYLFGLLQQGKMPLMLHSSPELKKLVYSMLEDNPRKRPEAGDILSHPLLQASQQKNETPAEVIKRCKTPPVHTGDRKLRQGFFSLRPEDVRIPMSALKAFREREDRDLPDAPSLGSLDWELVQPGLRQPGLQVILRVLRDALGLPSSEEDSEEELTDEIKNDPAAVREYYLKQFEEVRSGYKRLLSEATVEQAIAALASSEDLDTAWARLAGVLGERLTDHGHNLFLLYLAEVGCGQHLYYRPASSSSSWRCWPL